MRTLNVLFSANQRPNAVAAHSGDCSQAAVRRNSHTTNNMQNQNSFQVEAWSDAHQEGLSIPDRVNLIRMEDVKAAKMAKMVKYAEPQSGGVEPVVTLPMKRYFAAGSFTTFCIVVIAAAEQGAFAAAASIGGYIVFIGGGVGIAFALIRSCFVWTHGAQAASGTPPPPNDGGKYEWYQEQSQRQGWRKM